GAELLFMGFSPIHCHFSESAASRRRRRSLTSTLRPRVRWSPDQAPVFRLDNFITLADLRLQRRTISDDNHALPVSDPPVCLQSSCHERKSFSSDAEHICDQLL